MTLQPNATTSRTRENFRRLRIFAVVLTMLAIALFGYFIYSVGVFEIAESVSRIGIAGFGLLLLIYLLRICVRASAWKLSVYEPYELKFKDTFQAVIIGEAVSSIIPLGILASGTSKAVAVSNRIPLVAGLSSVATENLFYTFITSLFIISGAVLFLFSLPAGDSWVWSVYVLIALIIALLLFVFLILLRQWHLISGLCDLIYDLGFFRRTLENGRLHVRLFENIIFNFYRRYPSRFLPICFFEILYHACGVAEVMFILSRVSDAVPTLYNAFLLESVSRVVTIAFKLIPFAIGVDEMSSQFISESLALGVAVGLTIALLRKGRTLFWAVIGMIVILARGIRFTEILREHSTTQLLMNEADEKN